jgi:hypothetical protein
VIAPGLTQAAVGVLDGLVEDDAEIVTVFVGSGADDDATKAILEHIEALGFESTVVSGGQALYPYLFGVE